MALFAAPPQISPLAAANPLQDLIAGLQQGLQLRQLPQQIADQELQKRLNNALLAQKLADLQNPEQALTRKITEELALKGALNPDLGIQKAPAGLTGETIYNPQAIPFTGNELENALRESVGMAVPSAQQLQPTTPIAPFGIQTGLNLNPNVPTQAAERDFLQELGKEQQKSDIIQNRQIAVDKSKEEAKARVASAKTISVAPGHKVIDAITKEVIFENPAIEKAKKQTVVHPGDIVLDENNNPIFTAPQATGAGLKPTGETSDKFTNMVDAYISLQDIGDVADKLEKSGKFPGSVDTFISQALSRKPTDIPGAGLIPGAAEAYAAIQQKLQEARDPKIIEYEAMRSELAANIIRAQAGLSQTTGEIANVLPYTPQTTDTVASLKVKLNNLKKVAERKIGSYQLIYPSFREIDIPGYTPRDYSVGSATEEPPDVQAPVRTSGTSTDGIKFELAKPSQ